MAQSGEEDVNAAQDRVTDPPGKQHNMAPVRYVPVELIGSGTFGTVYKAFDTLTKQFVAIKLIERGAKVTKYVQREVANHRRLLHAHIVQLLEYCPGGDLFEYVVGRRGLNEDEARWFFQQLMVAVDYLHKLNIVSRDIKLENALLTDSARPLLKLCDFGYSKHDIFDSAPGSRVGTPAYLAPEVVKATCGDTYDGKKSDVWSCGVMLYIMLAGCYPFERAEDRTRPGCNMQRMIQRIINVDYVMPTNVSPEAQDLLGKLLVANPQSRLSVEGILSHPWYTTGLPAGVLEMNNVVLEPVTAQSEQDVHAILMAAVKPPDGGKGATQRSHDQLIERAIAHAQRNDGGALSSAATL